MGDTEQEANVASEAPTNLAEVTSENSTSANLVKIYLGGLPSDLDEDSLKSLLSEKTLPEAESVLVKRGYAFLEFGDKALADQVISVLDGKKV